MTLAIKSLDLFELICDYPYSMGVLCCITQFFNYVNWTQPFLIAAFFVRFL